MAAAAMGTEAEATQASALSQASVLMQENVAAAVAKATGMVAATRKAAAAVSSWSQGQGAQAAAAAKPGPAVRYEAAEASFQGPFFPPLAHGFAAVVAAGAAAQNAAVKAVPAQEEQEEAAETAGAPGAAAAAAAAPTGLTQAPLMWNLRSTSERLSNRRNSPYIDMSLDDFIKLQRKEQAQKQALQNERSNFAMNRRFYQAYNQNLGFVNEPQQFRTDFGYQNNYYRRNSQNSFKPRAFPSFAVQFPPKGNFATSEESGGSDTVVRQFRNQMNQPEIFGRQLVLGPASKSFPSDARSYSETSKRIVISRALTDRAMQQKQQRDNKVNQNRGIPSYSYETHPAEVNSPSNSRYQIQINPGSTLIVSVNPHWSQSNTPERFRRYDGETAYHRWNLPNKPEKFKPRGISLRYNFRAIANQTNITLNERFSALKVLNEPVTKPGNRIVILP